MDESEIANRIALLFNPMPDMSGRQIDRLHGERRRQVEDIARDIVAEHEKLRGQLRDAMGIIATITDENRKLRGRD